MRRPTKRLVDLTGATPDFQVAVLASRMCLVLERFLSINGYRMPDRELLEHAIAFFQTEPLGASAGDAGGRLASSGSVSPLLLEALERAKMDGDVSVEITPQQFCDIAITALRWLAEAPERVPKGEKQKLSDFFIALEKVTGQSVHYSNP